MAEHKHAEVLRAIADGKAVQWYAQTSEKWEDFILGSAFNPIVLDCFEWRVKPEPKPDVVRYVIAHDLTGWPTLEDAKRRVEAAGYVRVTIDGETGKLKSVEIVE